jgi:D-3-phosphoglycerate dehydrogenase
MINKDTLAKMKKGAMLINCARGGIVNEDDLYEALASGHLGGAALDVFATEPPGKTKLMELPNFICTPHLGASTREAQENVAEDVANQIVDYLLNGNVKNAVNVPTVSSELMTVLKPYTTLAEKMGSLQAQLTDSPVKEIQIRYEGKITEYDLTPLTTAAVKGLLTPILKDDVNYINAPIIASERGIKVVESKSSTSEDFSTLITITVKSAELEHIVTGTIFGKSRPRILRIDNFFLEAIPEGHLLLIYNEDSPGTIGLISTLLGKNNVNIDRMQVTQDKGQKQNAMLLATNPDLSDSIVMELRALSCVSSVRKLEL